MILGCLERYGTVRPVTRLYEAGSGSGRMLVAFARRGLDVVGLDRSDAMLAFTRDRVQREGLSARVGLERGDMRAVPAGPACDGALCLLSTFRYLASESDVLGHLASLAARVRPGGVYVVDFRLAERAARTPLAESWALERDGTRVVCRWRFTPPAEPPGVGSERLELEVTEGGADRRLIEELPSRLDTWESFEMLVAGSGAWRVAAYLGPSRDPAQPRPAGRVEGRTVAVLVRKDDSDCTCGPRAVHSAGCPPASGPDERRGEP